MSTLLRRIGAAVYVLVGLLGAWLALPVGLQAQLSSNFWTLTSGSVRTQYNVAVPTSAYVNFGSTVGTSGYGMRDSGGQVQFKDSGGAWTAVSAGASTNFWSRTGNELNTATSGDVLSLGGTGNTTALIGIQKHITDPLIQFGINVTPSWDVTGVESTGVRVVQNVGTGAVMTNGAGIVVEVPSMGAGSSIGQFASAYFRGTTGAAGTFPSFAYTLMLGSAQDGTIWLGTDLNNTTAQGGIYWGLSKDTTLYRSAVGQLTTDGKLRVSGSIGIVGAPSAIAALAIGQSTGIPSSGATSKVVYNTGQMPATTTTTGIAFSSEPSTVAAAFTLTTYVHYSSTTIGIGAASAVTNQYAWLSGPLTTAANNFGVAIGGASTATLWINQDADNTTAPYGAFWGASRDTNLYRSAAGVLKSDSSIVAKSVRGVAGTFASVPASPVEGMLVAVTDSNTAVWGATIAGSGGNHVLAYYNGTNWTVAGK